MLEVRNINVFYGELQVLWNVSLNVNKGEIATLIGSNGSGKTTLCKTIIGVLSPKSGSITFLGKRIDKISIPEIIRQGITIVPEGRRIFGHMTVRENLELGAYASETRKELKDALEWVFNLFPILKERQSQIAGCMSGGEQQMLAIARGLMSKPKLLILDEPSLGLAPKIVIKIYDIINKIRDEGVTILLVEQYADRALANSDRGFVLENGRIVIDGPSQTLLKDERVKKAYLGEE
ncbi:MAG: ABC transporter ATP-binding protein [Candidatus Bathyarchaeia archaeon]|nr:ABC transporter ATP-binding protein [Candidatus Bathyarchaeota archaeon]